MLSLTDIPIEVLIDNFLPYVPLASIPALALASRDLAALCSDDTFWKRKLQEDYNFSDASTARTTGGYKFLYRGFHRAGIYVWGSAGEGRLGLDTPTTGQGSLIGRMPMPYPMKLDLSGTRIVELAAGGWSFHALDAKGCIHVWGQLDGLGFGLNVDSFALPSKRASSPLELALPEKITQISCGRRHAAALSAAHRVWIFTAWGTPYIMAAPIFPAPPCQVECGWNFVALLTQAGDVYVWWPFDGEFGERTEAHEGIVMGDEERPGEVDGAIQCRPWELDARPEQMLAIMSELPQLRGSHAPVGEKIVKIAGGDEFLIALTDGGHVLRTDFELGPASFGSVQGRPRWKYLPLFSEVRHIRSHPTFSSENNGRLVVPEDMHITHISAHFEAFFAYTTGSSSIVLQGKKDAPPLESIESTLPIILPALQNKGIISVVLGDYHFGALTSAGKLFTWGAYSSGALGLGDPLLLPVGAPGGYPSQLQRTNALRFRTLPPDVTEPAEVKFGTRAGGDGRNVFVFSIAAAGWHMGALVIDLEENEDEGGNEVLRHEISNPPSLSYPLRGRLPFRIGLAGARTRGRGGRFTT